MVSARKLLLRHVEEQGVDWSNPIACGRWCQLILLMLNHALLGVAFACETFGSREAPCPNE